MKKPRIIQVFEHDKLRIGDQGFSQLHLDAMLRLNEYHQGAYFEPIAKGVKFSQYVGVIQIDGLTIEIHPKADKDEDSAPWRHVLLNMLKACGKLKASTTGAANVNRRHLNLLEVYFEFYLREVEGLTRMGLIKKYRKEMGNVKALKGKLEFAANIRHNLIHKERFFTSHQVYDHNHLLHQILAHALDIVTQFTKGTRLNDFAKRVLLNFPEVDRRPIELKQLSQIKLNRKSVVYSYALELARLIILNYSPDTQAGNERMLSLLFDMNQLWEIYIYKQVQKAVRGTGITVIPQDSKRFWGSNSLRPDVVLEKDGKTFIIDTKWKRPPNKSASVEDLRQMYTYCRFWDADKAMLLYPGIQDNALFKAFDTKDYYQFETSIFPINHMCKIGLISVLNDSNNLDPMVGSKVLELLEM